MSDLWKQGTPKELLDELRPGGWVVGHTALLPKHLRLHKTDLMADLRNLQTELRLTWRIVGDPEATGRHAAKRRTVVVWLGK